MLHYIPAVLDLYTDQISSFEVSLVLAFRSKKQSISDLEDVVLRVQETSLNVSISYETHHNLVRETSKPLHKIQIN